MRESRSEHEKSALSQPKLPCQVIASLCPWIPSSPGRERESTEAVANWRAKMTIFTPVGCDRNRMPFLSKASNVVQNVFFLYDVTGFTQIRHSIPVATSCTPVDFNFGEGGMLAFSQNLLRNGWPTTEARV